MCTAAGEKWRARCRGRLRRVRRGMAAVDAGEGQRAAHEAGWAKSSEPSERPPRPANQRLRRRVARLAARYARRSPAHRRNAGPLRAPSSGRARAASIASSSGLARCRRWRNSFRRKAAAALQTRRQRSRLAQPVRNCTSVPRRGGRRCHEEDSAIRNAGELLARRQLSDAADD